MAQSNSQLRFLAEPQLSYRERYNSELDPKRNRAQRFIRAETNSEQLDYPTIEVKFIFKIFSFYLFINCLLIRYYKNGEIDVYIFV